jgi:hypothetical protein
VGWFSKGSSWRLEVNPDGSARLRIQDFRFPKDRRFKVAPEQLAQLRKAIVSERFFDLDNDYGDRVPDGSTRTLTIGYGKQRKTVRFHFLTPAFGGGKKVPEMQRALRVWNTVRAWFSDAEAVDDRPYQKDIMNAR